MKAMKPTKPRFMHVAGSTHSSFCNLFYGGAEYRKMMESEKRAALVKLVCLCADISKFVAKHIACQWSGGLMLNAAKLKENMISEYSDLMNRWRKQVAMEREASKPIFPRTTLSQTNGFKAAIREEEQLMQLIRMYSSLQKSSMEVMESHCRTIAIQAATLASVLTGMVKESALPSIHQCLTVAISNSTRNFVVALANKSQVSVVLNRLQSTKSLASSVVMELSNQTLYVFSYVGDADHYCGLIFLDTPVHTQAASTRRAKIAYIETLPYHRKCSVAKRLIQWIKTTAKENGYQSLYAESVMLCSVFWIKSGFHINAPDTAACNLDPMSVENLVSRASI